MALPQLSLRWVGRALGVVGIVLLIFSVRSASQRIDRLRSWPSAEARVDDGDVVSLSRRGRREALYAARLRLRYVLDGREHLVSATEEVFSSGYAARARDVRRTLQERRVRVLVDPDAPSAPVLNAGYNLDYFFSSLVFAWVGGCLVFLAVVFSRMLRDEDAGAPKQASGGSGARWMAAFFAVLGIGFVGGGGTLFRVAHREATAWKTVDARVDSTDVVWRSSSSGGSGASRSTSTGLYAARAWITYLDRDAEYHVPVIRGAYSNDSSEADDVAAAMRQGPTMRARIDPGDPFEAALERPGAVRRFWLPALFFLPGLVCLWLSWLFGRTTTGKRRSRRARAKATPPSLQSSKP